MSPTSSDAHRTTLRSPGTAGPIRKFMGRPVTPLLSLLGILKAKSAKAGGRMLLPQICPLAVQYLSSQTLKIKKKKEWIPTYHTSSSRVQPPALSSTGAQKCTE